MWSKLFARDLDELTRFAWRLVALGTGAAVLVGAVAALTLHLTVPALAQAVAAPAARVFDFGPLVYAAVEFVAPIVVSFGGPIGVWILVRVLRVFGLKQDALQRAVIEQGMDRAIGFAMTQLGDRAAGGIPVAMKSEAIQRAAGYATKTIPSALKYFRKDGQAIAEMVEARLEGVLVDPDVERRDAATRAVATIQQRILGGGAPVADTDATRILR